MGQLRAQCLDSFQGTSSDMVHQILRQAQATLKTIDQFLGKSPAPTENGKKVLTDVDQELNVGLSVIADRVYAQVSQQVNSFLFFFFCLFFSYLLPLTIQKGWENINT